MGLLDGLLARYSFDTVNGGNDISGNGRHLVSVGAPTFHDTGGYLNSGWVGPVNGVNYLKFDNPAWFNAMRSMVITYRNTAFGSGQSTFSVGTAGLAWCLVSYAVKSNLGNGHRLFINPGPGNGTFDTADGYPGVNVFGGAVLAIAGAALATFYINGGALTNVATDHRPTGVLTGLRVGNLYLDGSQAFGGDVSYLAFWDRELTAAEAARVLSETDWSDPPAFAGGSGGAIGLGIGIGV